MMAGSGRPFSHPAHFAAGPGGRLFAVRLRMDLAYDGTDFHGWAKQTGLRTVQGELEGALTTILRVPRGRGDLRRPHRHRRPRPRSGHPRRRRAAEPDVARPASPAGRSPARRRPRTSRGRRRPRVRRPLLGGLAPVRLPDRRRPGGRRPADPQPRARLAAAARRRRDQRRVLGPAGPPRLRVVLQEARGATTIRTLLDLSWVRDENGLVTGTVRADAFCHHMVRSLVGCLVAVGEGQRPVGWAGDILAADEARLGRARGGGPRPDAGGGRLPAGRRARRPGRGGPSPAHASRTRVKMARHRSCAGEPRRRRRPAHADAPSTG